MDDIGLDELVGSINTKNERRDNPLVDVHHFLSQVPDMAFQVWRVLDLVNEISKHLLNGLIDQVVVREAFDIGPSPLRLLRSTANIEDVVSELRSPNCPAKSGHLPVKLRLILHEIRNNLCITEDDNGLAHSAGGHVEQSGWIPNIDIVFLVSKLLNIKHHPVVLNHIFLCPSLIDHLINGIKVTNNGLFSTWVDRDPLPSIIVNYAYLFVN